MTDPQYGFTYHYKDTDPANYKSDLDAVAAALHGSKSASLQVRLDINWADVDRGSFSGMKWKPKLNMSAVDNVFKKVLRPGDEAIVILSTHSPPAALKPLFPFATPAQWQYPKAANNFVTKVVKHVAVKGWLDSVAAWQISDEPNNLAFSGIAGWDTIVVPLNTFLETIRTQDTTAKPRIINMYQIAASGASLFFRPDPWDDMFDSAAKLGVSIGSNFEVMGADIYPDQWGIDFDTAQVAFQKAVTETVNQMNRASAGSGFTGSWGVLEMAAGPRADVLRGTTTPSAQDIGACIAEAKAANPTMIVPFQVRGSINPNDVNSFYGHSYGLIDDSTGAPRSDYLAAIQAAV